LCRKKKNFCGSRVDLTTGFYREIRPVLEKSEAGRIFLLFRERPGTFLPGSLQKRNTEFLFQPLKPVNFTPSQFDRWLPDIQQEKEQVKAGQPSPFARTG
jgi:hypothetical protein